MDEGKLDELARSLRENGLINPVTVCPGNDGRFEVVAGHRRLTAARQIGWVEIDCRVWPDRDTAEAAKIAENLDREELSPVDEACFYAQLDMRLHDTDAIAAMVKRTRKHVEDRLELLRFEEKVLESLRAGHIVLGVAWQLHLMKSKDDQLYYLHFAERDGAKVAEVTRWRMEANSRIELAELAAQRAAAGAGSGPEAVSLPEPPKDTYRHHAMPWQHSARTELRPCMFCNNVRPEHEMYIFYLCPADASAWKEEQGATTMPSAMQQESTRR